jgi:excisionase family DNA binding protein
MKNEEIDITAIEFPKAKSDNSYPVFFTTAEIAKMLKMNPQVIARKIQRGEISAYKIGKDWRVAEADFWAWLKKHSNRKLSDKEKTLSNFMRDGRVIEIPVQRKKRRFILEYILEHFESNRVYQEKEVNEIIRRFHEDFCFIRREFIMNKMMTRAEGKYRRNDSYVFSDRPLKLK